MTRSRFGPRIVLFVATGCAPAAFAGTTVVEGTVVDAAGKPVRGAEIAAHWDLAHGTLVASEGEISDAKGAFRIVLDVEQERIPVLAFDAARKSAQLAWYDPKQPGARLSVTLGGVTSVSITPSTDLAAMPADAKIALACGDGPPLVTTSAAEGVIRLPLPPGDYRARAFGPDRETGTIEHLIVAEGATTLDGGELKLPASSISKWFGLEPPPLTISDARGIAREIRWTDLRGKWVLIEFWGFW